MACSHVRNLHPSYTYEQKHSQPENSTDVNTTAFTATVEFRLHRATEFCLGQEQWNQKSELPNVKSPGIRAVSNDKITLFQRGFCLHL
jgi:hypothetical protein